MVRLSWLERQANIAPYFDLLLNERWLPARWPHRIAYARELPPRLESFVNGLAPLAEWRAYSDDTRIYCAVAIPGTPEGDDFRTIALDVFFLDSRAKICAAGAWEFEAGRGWRLNGVLDIVDAEVRLGFAPASSGYWSSPYMSTPRVRERPGFAARPTYSYRRLSRHPKADA